MLSYTSRAFLSFGKKKAKKVKSRHRMRIEGSWHKTGGHDLREQ